MATIYQRGATMAEPRGSRIGLEPPAPVVEIAERLERAGYETWCVGGGVRDALLGRPQLDWDLATAARPEEVRAVFRRIVPKGIEFGTVGVFDRDGVVHEVTTFRRDVQTDGRHAVVEFGASLDDDLARRDFTINAIAWSPTRQRLHDPFDGRGDLARGVVRAVGDAPARMREDRLRALRAIRFASRFNFDIEPATWRAITESAPHLTRLSAERVKEELEKTMRQVARPSAALERWRASGALAVLVPALATATRAQLAAADCLPLPGLARRPQRLPNRLAVLWLGVAPAEAERAMRALRFANHQVRWVAELADRWAALAPELRAATAAGAVSDAQLRRWAARAGRLLVAPLLRLAAARFAAEREAGERAAAGPTPDAAAVRALYRRAVRTAYRDPVERADLAVSGADLTAAGIAPGPVLGRLLDHLLEVVVADPTQNTRERLLALARDAHASHGARGG
jgi:tRNA nucleotidyltransferase (CCA-adding enzyme)